jgi:hypothetical protein
MNNFDVLMSGWDGMKFNKTSENGRGCASLKMRQWRRRLITAAMKRTPYTHRGLVIGRWFMIGCTPLSTEHSVFYVVGALSSLVIHHSAAGGRLRNPLELNAQLESLSS